MSKPLPPIEVRFVDGSIKMKRRSAPYEVGELHRAWPEWAWNGKAFVPIEDRDFDTPELYWWAP